MGRAGRRAEECTDKMRRGEASSGRRTTSYVSEGCPHGLAAHSSSRRHGLGAASCAARGKQRRASRVAAGECAKKPQLELTGRTCLQPFPPREGSRCNWLPVPIFGRHMRAPGLAEVQCRVQAPPLSPPRAWAGRSGGPTQITRGFRASNEAAINLASDAESLGHSLTAKELPIRSCAPMRPIHPGAGPPRR